MKVKYVKKASEDVRIINFYTKEEEKKRDTDDLKYTNFKIEVKKEQRKTISEFVKIIRGAINRAKTHKLDNIAFDFEQIKDIDVENLTEENRIKLFIKNIFLTEYVFDKYKTKKSGRIKNIEIVGEFSKEEKNIFTQSEVLAEGIEYTRNFGNTPAHDMTPAIFSSEIKKMFKGVKNVSVKILEDKDTKKLKMGLYNAVGRGSINNSKFIIIEYKGGKKSEKPQVIVGKGICYDTGGLSLKPTNGMVDMHLDMSGAAVAAGAIYVLAKNKVKKNIVTIIPAVENAISGDAYRPGDIITAYDGTTVEIKNTDAEGRLVLADAISYGIDKFKPSKIIDVATLTGASMIAIGLKASIIMTNTKQMEKDLREIGNQTNDRVWPLPVWDDYKDDIKSDFADIANLSKNKFGGTITAGIFIKHFVDNKNKDGEIEWTHIDMAPRMDSAPGDGLAKGSAGEPVDLLVEYLKK